MTLPAHAPTEENRTKVTDFKSFGITNEEIADYLEISIETLRKYYREELRKGSLDSNSSIAKSLYRKALEGDVTAMIFWLKTRARWRTEDSIKETETDNELALTRKALIAELDKKNKKEF
jgi:predicted DNA-binding protein (UPF0278 family)